MIDIGTISANLERRENGIWYSHDVETVSYPTEGNEVCFSVEQDSFWFSHRNHCIVNLVKRFPPPDNSTLFDIGGGNGYVALGLQSAGFDVALVEPGSAGAQMAKNRGVNTVICATTGTARFQPRSLPAVGLFDVIEHIEDDVDFLTGIRHLMMPRGKLYATVPAYPVLWSDEDIIAGHFRRYTLSGIIHTLTQAGFEIDYASYFFRFLPIPALLLRALPYRLGCYKRTKTVKDASRDHNIQFKFMASIVASLLKPEIDNIASGIPMSFGASCLITASNPQIDTPM